MYGLVLLRLDEEISTVSTADTTGFNSLISSYNSTLGSSEILIHLSITIIAASSKARSGGQKQRVCKLYNYGVLYRRLAIGEEMRPCHYVPYVTLCISAPRANTQLVPFSGSNSKPSVGQRYLLSFCFGITQAMQATHVVYFL